MFEDDQKRADELYRRVRHHIKLHGQPVMWQRDYPQEILLTSIVEGFVMSIDQDDAKGTTIRTHPDGVPVLITDNDAKPILYDNVWIEILLEKMRRLQVLEDLADV